MDVQKIIAAIRYEWSQVSRGGGGALPRAVRALQGWRRHSEGLTWRPAQWLLVCAIIGQLLIQNLPDMVLAVLVMHLWYLRPKDLVF